MSITRVLKFSALAVTTGDFATIWLRTASVSNMIATTHNYDPRAFFIFSQSFRILLCDYSLILQ